MWCVEFMLCGLAESAYLINKIISTNKHPTNKPIKPLLPTPSTPPLYPSSPRHVRKHPHSNTTLLLPYYSSIIIGSNMLFDIEEGEHQP